MCVCVCVCVRTYLLLSIGPALYFSVTKGTYLGFSYPHACVHGHHVSIEPDLVSLKPPDAPAS
jgi:hypothetical protein